MQINGIHHIAISVKDLNRSVEFYKETLGFVQAQQFERKDLNGKAVFLKLGNMRMEIWEFRDRVEPKDDLSDLKVRGLRHIAFSVIDLDQIYKELKLKMIISQPRMGASGKRYSFMADPDGIPIELYEQ
jgi:glyoxylase I family protein